MAKQQAKTGLLSSALGTKAAQAFNNHKGEDTDYGQGGDCPAGIEGGVAQLTECKFDVHADGQFKGKVFFYAAGIVVAPKLADNGMVVEGLRTYQMCPLYDTPQRQTRKTQDDHLGWILNELRKLGLETANMEIGDLEDAVAALKEQKPYFQFRTWKGEPSKQYPNPRTNHVWIKALPDYVPEGGDPATAGVEETPAEEPDEQPDEPAPPPAKKTATAGKGAPPKKTPPPAAEPADDEPDAAALAEAADGGDRAAAAKLKELAMGEGIEEDAIDNADNWTAVAELIAASNGGGEPADDEPAEWVPVTKEVVSYKPKGAKKAIDCEVIMVNTEKQTVNLRSNVDKAVIKAVPFAEITQQ